MGSDPAFSLRGLTPARSRSLISFSAYSKALLIMQKSNIDYKLHEDMIMQNEESILLYEQIAHRFHYETADQWEHKIVINAQGKQFNH